MSQPLDLFLFLLFFFSLSFNTSYANPLIKFCPSPPQFCTSSSVPIQYPFSLVNNSSDHYCGYSGLRLTCSKGQPVMTLPNHDEFYVKEINYDSYSITLVDIDVMDETCPRVQYNISLGDLPLNYSSSIDLFLSFYFNCSSMVSDLSYSSQIGCLEFGLSQSFVMLGNQTDEVDWFGTCEANVVVAVQKSEFVSNNSHARVNDFGKALNEGFVLNWWSAKDCGVCEDSGGRCGYNTIGDQIFCFCPDGPIQSGHCKGHTHERRKVIIGVCTGLGSLAITCLIIFIYLRHKKTKYAHGSLVSRSIGADPSLKIDIENVSKHSGVHLFTYAELEEATNNFDTKQELGDGGFGTVYYGELRDGRVVAVKRLYENNCRRVEQFMNEVEILTRLRHPHLVTLYGCTSRHSRELLLVYEYISNGTVADHVHGKKAKPGSLPWHMRLNIAVETASALAYLHASDIIHRDVKTNNILLDNYFQVKVADFGLSRLFPLDVTHISTAPQGTPGYVDPEYRQCYQLTVKSDVYSFGVVLIELISSLPAVDITRHRHDINLSNMAINKILNDALHELVDKSLGFDSDYAVRKMVSAVAGLAFQCLQSAKELRPTMEEVLENLKDIQSAEYNPDNVEDNDMLLDDKGLLKFGAAPLSPNSVTFKWDSSITTPNTSS